MNLFLILINLFIVHKIIIITYDQNLIYNIIIVNFNR